jgi:glutamate/aspartate transport system substrate-binding protein
MFQAACVRPSTSRQAFVIESTPPVGQHGDAVRLLCLRTYILSVEFGLSRAREITQMLRAAGVIFALLISAVSASAQMQVPADSRLKSIVDTKTIRIAYRTDATPFAFVNDQKRAAGFSVDLCELATKSIARQIGVPELGIQWVPVTVQTRFSAISGNQADLECGSSTITLGRMKDVDFSNIIFVESTGVIVARAANVQSFADMAGKKVAAISGTTNERAIADQNKLHNLNLTIVTVKNSQEGIAALEGGKVDGYASDKLLLVGTRLKNPDKYVMLPDDLSIESYGITLPRGDWTLRLSVNTALAEIYGSGTIVAVFKKWFGQLGLEPGMLNKAAYAMGSLPE